MSSRKYREEELLDSVVVDREGYICGYISGFNIASTNIVINLCGCDVKKFEVINEEELTQRLLEIAPRKGITHRQLDIEEFYDWIRKSLNLSKNETINIEHLAKYASTKGIAVPKKFEETKIRTERGTIDWHSIDKIAFTDLGKSVILKDAVEAKKRGITSTDKVDFKSSKDLTGKIVIDSEGKIISSAVKLLIGYPPGISINLEHIKREVRIDIEALKKSVIPSRFKDEKEFLAQVKKDLKPEILSERDLVVWAKRNNVNVYPKTIERKEMMEIAISWDKIAKIGDVVMLKESAEMLSENAKPIPISK